MYLSVRGWFPLPLYQSYIDGLRVRCLFVITDRHHTEALCETTTNIERKQRVNRRSTVVKPVENQVAASSRSSQSKEWMLIYFTLTRDKLHTFTQTHCTHTVVGRSACTDRHTYTYTHIARFVTSRYIRERVKERDSSRNTGRFVYTWWLLMYASSKLCSPSHPYKVIDGWNGLLLLKYS